MLLIWGRKISDSSLKVFLRCIDQGAFAQCAGLSFAGQGIFFVLLIGESFELCIRTSTRLRGGLRCFIDVKRKMGESSPHTSLWLSSCQRTTLRKLRKSGSGEIGDKKMGMTRLTTKHSLTELI